MELVQALLIQLVLQLPIIAVWVVGIVLAVSRRAEHPRGYRFATIAFGIFIVMSVISTVTNVFIPLQMMQNAVRAAQVGTVLGLVNLVYRLGELVGWVLILIALFQRRSVSASDQVQPF